jgi:hypothetical protein
MGAVQSQDYDAATWALGMRARDVTECDVEAVLAEGAILRTHVLRPTWHFVLPQDIRWMLALSAPRIRRGIAARHRELVIDAHTVAHTNDTLGSALQGGHYLTRTELAKVLRAVGIDPSNQRLPHLLMSAELDAVVTSGPRRGKQFTWALFDERVPTAPVMKRSEAVCELAKRYFRSRGPAQAQDFVWWSGLTVADARAGIAFAGSALGHEVIDGKDYWFDADAGRPPVEGGVVHLLPNFDEYTVAYRDRSAILAGRLADPSTFSPANVLSNVITIDGRVRATWRRTGGRDAERRITIRSLDALDARERAAIEDAGRRLAVFLCADVRLNWL